MPLAKVSTVEIPKPHTKPELSIVPPEQPQSEADLVREYVALHREYDAARKRLDGLKDRARELANAKRQPGKRSAYLTTGERNGPCVAVLYGSDRAVLSDDDEAKVRSMLGTAADECLVPALDVRIKAGADMDALLDILQCAGLDVSEWFQVKRGNTVAGLDAVVARHPGLTRAVRDVDTMTMARRATVKVQREG